MTSRFSSQARPISLDPTKARLVSERTDSIFEFEPLVPQHSEHVKSQQEGC